MGEVQSSKEIAEIRMLCALANLLNWIEALAALVIVVLAYLTLAVLKDCAADTKMIAMRVFCRLRTHRSPF